MQDEYLYVTETQIQGRPSKQKQKGRGPYPSETFIVPVLFTVSSYQHRYGPVTRSYTYDFFFKDEVSPQQLW